MIARLKRTVDESVDELVHQKLSGCKHSEISLTGKDIASRLALTFQGRWETDFSLWLMYSCGHISTKPNVYTQLVAAPMAHEYQLRCLS